MSTVEASNALMTYKEAEALGSVALASQRSPAAKGMYDVMRRVREEGASNAYLDRLFTFQEFAQVVRLDRFREMEERYLPPSPRECSEKEPSSTSYARPAPLGVQPAFAARRLLSGIT
jgi:hypothetical protein